MMKNKRFETRNGKQFKNARPTLAALLAGLAGLALLAGCSVLAPEPIVIPTALSLDSITIVPPPTATAAPTATPEPSPTPEPTQAAPELIWIAKSNDAALFGVDPASNQVVQTIPVEAAPSQLVSAGSALWAGDFQNQLLMKIQNPGGQVELTLSVPGDLTALAGDSTSLWVGAADKTKSAKLPNAGYCPPGKILRIDPLTNQVMVEIPMPTVVDDLLIAGDKVWAITNCTGFSAINRIDPANNQAETLISSSSYPLTVPEELGRATILNGELWVASAKGGGAYRFDPVTRTLLGPETIGGKVGVITSLSSAGGVLWSTMSSGELYRYDPATKALTGPLEPGQGLRAMLESAGSVWAMNDREAVLTRLDLATGLAQVMIPVGTKPPVSALPTPAPEAEVAGFDCPDAPEMRLAAGMQARVVLNVYLRTSPEVRDDNIMMTLMDGVPLWIDSGPVCGEYERGAYIYWKIHFEHPSLGRVEGWMAEGAPNRNFIERYIPPVQASSN